MFINLEDINGCQHIVNTNHIISFHQEKVEDCCYTYIKMVGELNNLKVKQTPEDIIMKLNMLQIHNKLSEL